MLVKEIAQYFRILVDEQDSSFLTNGTVSSFLALGYNEFRRFVSNNDQNGYTNTVQFPITNVMEYDLGGSTSPVRVLGPTPTTTRMYRLLSLQSLNGDGTIKQLWKAAANMDELRKIGFGYGDGYMQGVGPYFLFQNTKLKFSIPINDTFALNYVPVSTVDWTKLGPTDTEFVDDYGDYHDLIALFAARHYAIPNGQANPMADTLLAARTAEFNEYLSYGRVPGSSDHVCREY